MRTPLVAGCITAAVTMLVLTALTEGEASPTTVTTTTPPATTTTTTAPPNARAIMEAGVPTTTTTTTVAPAGGRDAYRHPDWIALAISVGWPNDPAVLRVLDTVIERESNGRPDAQNPRDPGSMGSLGLTQINTGAWCDSTKYWPDGFMQQQNIGLTTCSDLFDPVVNLKAALVIWTRQHGFGAWSTV